MHLSPWWPPDSDVAGDRILANRQHARCEALHRGGFFRATPAWMRSRATPKLPIGSNSRRRPWPECEHWSSSLMNGLPKSA